MLFAATIVALLSLCNAFPWSENKWVHVVRVGDVKAAHNVDCEVLGTTGMKQSLAIDKQDETLSVVIKQCQRILPSGREFDKYAYDLYISNLPLSFNAFISNGKCSQISREMMQHLLAAMVDNNSVDFVRSIVHQCVVNEEDWQAFIHRAEIMRRTEILLIVRDQGGFVGKNSGGFGTATWPSTPTTQVAAGYQGSVSTGFNQADLQQPVQPANRSYYMSSQPATQFQSYPQQQTQSQQQPSRQQQQQPQFPVQSWTTQQPSAAVQPGENYQKLAQPTTPNQVLNSTPGVSAGVYHGHLIKICPEVVSGNLLILAQITPVQAARFGLLGEGCVGFTATHFQQPGVSPSTVGNLPLRCFQNIPPEAFAGLTAQMIERIKWWAFITRDQIKYIQAGDPIRAVPFDQLGLGRQKSPDDKIHPCWNITRAQIQALKKDSTIYKEYSKRCMHSGSFRRGTLFVSIAVVIVSLLISFL